MWEWNYAKEPFDMKLFILRLVKKIWIPVVAALLGAAVVGGGYFLSKEVFGGPDTYEITSTYYVEYGKDPETGNEYTYINYASWNNWIKTDFFVDNIWSCALEAGLEPEQYGMEKADLKNCLFADLPSDLRMPVSKVTTLYPRLTEELAKAVEEAFVMFGESQKEIDAIRLVDTTEVAVSDKNVRTLRACVLGGVLAAFFSLIVMMLYYIADDGIYVPATFACRYGIAALGSTAGYGEELHLLKGTSENVAYRFRDCKTIAVTSVEEDTDLKAVAALLEDTDPEEKSYVCIPSILQIPEAAEKLREADGVLLLAESGICNGKQIEKALYQLKLQDCKVEGVLLTGVDENLVKAYELTGYRGRQR